MSDETPASTPTVTHLELRAKYPTGGIAATACPGVLELVTQLDDPDAIRGTSRVEVWACRGCGRRIAADATRGVILNEYEPPPIDLVRELAKAWTLPEGGAR